MPQIAQVLSRFSEGVLTLTLDNPQSRNALTMEMSQTLVDRLRDASNDFSVRVVVVTGSGNAFCAGGDVKAMAAGRDAGMSLEARAQRLRGRAEAIRLLHEMPKPTVALLPGAAAGAGLGVALACDFRLGSDQARLATAFAKVGLAGDLGVSWLLTQMLGAARTRELLMLAPVLNAQEALALGLLSCVFAAGDYERECVKFVAALASGPTVAYGHIKRNVNLSVASALGPALDAEALHQARCMMTEDHESAAQAFADKRMPVFQGR